MFWIDEIIKDILKKINKDSYLITDWTTPSGHAHIGSLRGVIIHDLIRHGLEEKGKSAVFQYGFDDFDPMDGFPSYLDESFRQYMGKPLCNIPAPDGVHKSFAEQFADEFIEVFYGLGIKPKIVKSSDLYKSGQFDEAIKIILDNAATIRKIYQEISGSQKGDDWFPFEVVCPKCGKIGTTLVTAWDGKEVEFTCQENLVKWAKGCGNASKIAPFSGNGKLPWKVEWPAKWYIFKTDIEGEGKDHFAAGGSRDVADKIYRDIFKKYPPFDIRYEHFLVGGAKMSSSKGLGVTAKEMADFLPPEFFRFLFIRTRPMRAIDFQIEGETIPQLFDEYDKMAELFQKDPQNDLAKSFYYSQIEEEKELLKYVLRFSKIAFMLQMPRVDILQYAQKEKANEAKSTEAEDQMQSTKLTAVEVAEIKERMNIAKKWLEKFAPEKYKFTVQEILPETAKKLLPNQKKFIARILEVIETGEERSGEDLHQEIHKIRKDLVIDPREAFSAIYLVFIGKDSGPQAGWFLASLDKDFVVKRLKEVI